MKTSKNWLPGRRSIADVSQIRLANCLRLLITEVDADHGFTLFHRCGQLLEMIPLPTGQYERAHRYLAAARRHAVTGDLAGARFRLRTLLHTGIEPDPNGPERISDAPVHSVFLPDDNCPGRDVPALRAEDQQFQGSG